MAAQKVIKTYPRELSSPGDRRRRSDYEDGRQVFNEILVSKATVRFVDQASTWQRNAYRGQAHANRFFQDEVHLAPNRVKVYIKILDHIVHYLEQNFHPEPQR